MSCNHSQRKVIPSIMLAVNVSSNTAKKEETNRRTYHSLQELQLSIFEYIEGFYNSRRPHGSLGMLTPNEKEELFWNQA